MALEYDPLLLIGLRREIAERYRGVPVREVWLDPERRRAGIGFREGAPLLFLLHPTRGHLLADPPLPRVPSARREEFRKAELRALRVPPDERLLELELGTPGHDPRWRVVVELHTNQWNLLLLRLPGEEIRDVLWPRSPGGRVLRSGARYRPPSGEREGAERRISAERWRELLEPAAVGERRTTALRNIAYMSGINVEWVLGGALDCEGPEALDDAYDRYRELLDVAGVGADAGVERPPAWLLAPEDAVQPYVHPLGGESAARAPSLLDAMHQAARDQGVLDEIVRDAPGAPGPGAAEEPPDPELLELAAALRSRRDELERRRAALERELAEADDPERLRAVGHLLLARKNEVPRGERRVRLEDFDGSTTTVELDPSLDAAGNARRYYREASRRERAVERLPREIHETEVRARRVEEALDRLQELLAAGESPPEEQIEACWHLAGGRPDEQGRARAEERLPYRVLRTSGGLEVRVGRSAKDNEELTFHHSAPDDIWLHARQVAGSHVVLRWGHREGNPPRRDLLEAAVAAALNSKARHSGTVGVDWTRRKYVRSPRKSPPGVVVPERVQTLFVHPDEAVVKRMAACAGEGD